MQQNRFELVHQLANKKKIAAAESNVQAHIRVCPTCRRGKLCADRKTLELEAGVLSSKYTVQ